MKAITFERYGAPAEVLRLVEVPKPVPRGDEVLVAVRAASVNAADWRVVAARPFLARFHSGLLRPKRVTSPGADVAGVVEAVGPAVRRLKVGDAVFGDVFRSNLAGFAEYKCAREGELALKPASASFEEAAAIPLAGTTALHAVRDVGQVRPGERVLVMGASGGVGTYAVQLARHLGAEVTAVCSTGKAELARSLGAHHVVDYTREDALGGAARYDLILGVNGDRSILDYRRALAPRGRYAMVGGAGGQLFQALLFGGLLSLGAKKMRVVSSQPVLEDLVHLAELFEAGKLRPVLDRRFPLAEAAEAIRLVEAGHVAGKVIVTV
ncbi:MAG: NAD(P)-dependent alcohol dehydrogenase [Anaeromyxobacter sp.]